MNKQTITQFFPLKTKVSIWSILFCNRYDPDTCIGAKTLSEALAKSGLTPKFNGVDISWGYKNGRIDFIDDSNQNVSLFITTENNTNFMSLNIFSKRKVTFIIESIYEY